MSTFSTEAFTLLGIGLGIISLRSYVRIDTVGLRGLKPDDYLMVVAAVVYTLETVTAYEVGNKWHGLANSGMTDEERKSLDPHGAEYAMRVGGSKTQIIGWSLYTLLLWTLKLSMNIFYERLTFGVDNMSKRIRISLGLVGVTYIATILSILLGCTPIHKNWQIYPNPGNHCQPAISKIDIYVTVVLNVLTDLFLMSIPMPMLWKASIPVRQKSILLVMFSGGIFVMMAGILRCALILADPVKGAQAAGSWAVRETFVAVVIGNLPMIYPLLRKGLSSVFPRFGSQKDFTAYERQTDSYPLSNGRQRAGGVVSLNTSVSRNQSEERILGAGKSDGISVTTWTDIETKSRHEGTSDVKRDEIADGGRTYHAYIQKGDSH